MKPSVVFVSGVTILCHVMAEVQTLGNSEQFNNHRGKIFFPFAGKCMELKWQWVGLGLCIALDLGFRD